MSLSLFCEEDDDDQEDNCCSPCCVNYQPAFQNPRNAPICRWLKQVNEDNVCQSCCCQEKFDCYDDCRNCLISCYRPAPPQCTWRCCQVKPPCCRPPPCYPPQPVCCKPPVCCKKIVKVKPCSKSSCSVVCKQSCTGSGCDSLKGVVAVLVLMIVIIIAFYINSKLPTERKTCCCIANFFK